LLLLASDAGRFICGTTIVVDGGQVVSIRGGAPELELSDE